MKPFHKEQLGKVRTKIVATVGPASSDPAILRQMAEAGVNVFRLNFSHGTHAEHTVQLQAIRRISEEVGLPMAILQDLCGPKIRLGEILGGAVSCDHDAVFILAAEPVSSGDPHYLTCSYRPLPDELEMGQTVLFADGTVAMEVIAREPGRAWLKVTLPGLIRSHQGINVPGGALSVSALTDKDLSDLEWTAAHDVAYVGLSFVRRAEDIIQLRRELEVRGVTARIVAKIEKREALANLDAIIAEADAVMVARGDLGVELDVTRVPAVQKRIIAACHAAGAGDHGDPDAQQHGDLQPAHPRRGERRLQRRTRRHRRLDALGRDGDRPVPDRGGRDHEPDRGGGRVGLARTGRLECIPGRAGPPSLGRRRTMVRTDGPRAGRAGRPGPADHRERGRGRQPDLPPHERRTADRRDRFRPYRAGALEAAQSCPYPGAGPRRTDRPRHVPVLGRHTPGHARVRPPRPAPCLRR